MIMTKQTPTKPGPLTKHPPPPNATFTHNMAYWDFSLLLLFYIPLIGLWWWGWFNIKMSLIKNECQDVFNNADVYSNKNPGRGREWKRVKERGERTRDSEIVCLLQLSCVVECYAKWKRWDSCQAINSIASFVVNKKSNNNNSNNNNTNAGKKFKRKITFNHPSPWMGWKAKCNPVNEWKAQICQPASQP